MKSNEEFNKKLEDLFGYKIKNNRCRSKNKKINSALELLEKGLKQVKVSNIKPTSIPSLRKLERRGYDIFYDDHKQTMIIEKNNKNRLF